MNKERLLDAARRLRLVPPEKFDISVFTTCAAPRLWVENPSDMRLCGSSACLLGWLPVWYPKDWIYFKGSPVLLGGSRSAFECGARWFGITDYELNYLALPGHYPDEKYQPTPSQVADRIEKMVEQYNSENP
jgi:hypothetical protein